MHIPFPILFHYAYYMILNTVPCAVQLDLAL